MRRIDAARRYHVADDLCVVTCYFNPCGYQTKKRNYEVFKDSIICSGLALTTIECAFGTDEFQLTPGDDVIRVRASDVMWQKERLLELAIRRLPSRWQKVAWLDCDVLFENPAWAIETSEALNRLHVVQPFETAIRLPRGQSTYTGKGVALGSFGALARFRPQSLRNGDYEGHGETGLGWAARRELIANNGLYDACVVGGADHVMAHAMLGDWSSVCIDRIFGLDNNHREHFVAWAAPFYQRVRGAIGHVPGAALHLWHGEIKKRNYSLRHRELESFGFDPETDLRLSETGCWAWRGDKPSMHNWVASYFVEREEDGPRIARDLAGQTIAETKDYQDYL